MKTDKQIFGIFAAFPQWIFELTGLPWAVKNLGLTAELIAPFLFRAFVPYANGVTKRLVRRRKWRFFR